MTRKFTSEDLLKAMGLKVGQTVCVDNSMNFFITERNDVVFENLRSHSMISIEKFIEYAINYDYTIIQPKPTLTEDEKSLAKLLFNKGYKYVFNNKHSFNCCVSETKPIRDVNKWRLQEDLYYSMNMFPNLFQFIKWEDEPYSIEELLKE